MREPKGYHFHGCLLLNSSVLTTGLNCHYLLLHFLLAILMKKYHGAHYYYFLHA